MYKMLKKYIINLIYEYMLTALSYFTLYHFYYQIKIINVGLFLYRSNIFIWWNLFIVYRATSRSVQVCN